MRSKLTKKQIQANRECAKKSTGPRTSEGKARSARNALKHGMYAESLLVFGENERLLDEITRQYYEDYAPANIHERMLLEQMIFAQWRLLRVARSRVPAHGVVNREQAQSIPVNPFADPLSESIPAKPKETEEFHDAGFVPAKCDSGPPVSSILPGRVIYPPEEEAA